MTAVNNTMGANLGSVKTVINTQLRLIDTNEITCVLKVNNTCGSSKECWLSSKTEADAIDDG